jgi:hypothetical protein
MHCVSHHAALFPAKRANFRAPEAANACFRDEQQPAYLLGAILGAASLSCLHYIISLATQMDVCCKVSMRKKIYHGDWCGLKACEIFTGDTRSAKSP